jgi:hypothetical protein
VAYTANSLHSAPVLVLFDGKCSTRLPVPLVPVPFHFATDKCTERQAWTVYSSVTGYFLYACTFSKLDKLLPKRVRLFPVHRALKLQATPDAPPRLLQIYRWFFATFKTSVAVGVLGYSLLLIEIFGAGLVAGPVLDPSFALLAIWYGLYFGILTRDAAEVASDRIAAALGTARKMAVSVRDCAICGGELQVWSVITYAACPRQRQTLPYSSVDALIACDAVYLTNTLAFCRMRMAA